MQGMLRSVVVPQFYLDLQNEKFETSFAIYHRRYSTNTNPKWPLAQPMRVLGHNGECHTAADKDRHHGKAVLRLVQRAQKFRSCFCVQVLGATCFPNRVVNSDT